MVQCKANMSLKLAFTAPDLVSPLSSPDVHTNDVNGFADDGTVGYDYEFIPTLDNKYMCPICLLALRDPVQTGCGHRFCHLCILRCIKKKARCPVDQMALSSKQLFQDRSAHREVLDLRVKCTHPGCQVTTELRNIQPHLEMCPFRKVLCRFNCGELLSPDEKVAHEQNRCLLRPVTCAICNQEFPFNSQKDHEEDCKQHQPVECPHCKHQIKRFRLNQHVNGECPQAPIKCVFDKVGCHQKLSRLGIQKHMEGSTQIHLQYLLSTVTALQRHNDELQKNLQEAKDKVKQLETDQSSPLDINMLGPSTSRMGLDDDTSDSVNIYDCDTDLSNVPTPGADENGEYDEIALIKAFNKHAEENGIPVTSSSASSGSSPRVPGVNGTGELPAGVTVASLQILQQKHTDHDQKIVSLDHHVRELSAKMDNQVLQMREIATKITSVESKLEQQELRCCNGLYYWRIKEYKQLRKSASTGETPVLHSPGFYTSPQGYRMCIRVNLDGVENAQGTHLSLFVHIMKGEFDDLLTWPFAGTITLTVINQVEMPQQRSHVSEVLEARSNLMAFQRATTERNQKGYGYIDFFPLNMIESQGFIKDNTLVIKAHVRVNEQPQK